MRVYLGILLAVVLIILFVYIYIKYKDVFHPLAFFAILQFLRYVPFMISGESDTNVLIDDQGVGLLFVMEMITIGCVIFGYSLVKTNKNQHSRPLSIYCEKSNNITLGYSLFVIGMIGRLYFVVKTGGFSYIFSNIQLKQTLVSGEGYLLALGYLMTFGICILISEYSKNVKFKASQILIIFIMIIINVILLGVMSDRAPVLISLMMIVMAYHYKVKRIKLSSLFKPKVILLCVLLILFVVAMPLLRNSEGFDKYGSISNLLKSAIGNLESAPRWFSFVGRDIFVYENFNLDNFWFGKNILNFICSPLPRSIFPWKPPVDEGIYLANMVAGFNIQPPSNIYPINNSYPFSNQGIFYANFGLIGLIIGGIMIGAMYKYTYNILKSKKFNIVLIIISQVIIYKWSFTSHDMVGSLSLIVYLVLPLIIKNALFRKNNKSKKC